MKRIIVAAVLLIVTAAICTAEYLVVKDCSESFTEKLEILEQSVIDKRYDDAYSEAKQLDSDWHEQIKTVDMLLYHDYVDSICVNLSSLPVFLKYGEYSEVESLCEQTKKQLLSLYESELPVPENII